MCDLINPIKCIANFNMIPQDYIDELVTQFTVISQEAIPYMNSKYIHIDNYTSYVYCIFDNLYNKWYIGVRYGKVRYHYDSISDLLKYQSSSKDIGFKAILKQNIENNTNRFTLSVLKEFTDEFHAMLYEAFIHQLFQVGLQSDNSYNPLFYNKTAEVMPSYKMYVSTYWDLANNVELNYKEITEVGNLHSDALRLLCNNTILTTDNGRFCLKENLCILPPPSRRQFEYITLYTLHEEGTIYTITKQYWEWVNILGKNFHELVNGYSINKKNNKGRYSIDGYFYYKEKVDEAYKEYIINHELISLYHHDTIIISITTKTYKAWKDEIGKCFVLMMSNPNGVLAKGYFKTVKACEDDLDKYTVITMFSIDNLRIISEYKTKLEWCKFFNIVMSVFNMKLLKNYSCNNGEYFFNIEQCKSELQKYDELTLYYVKDNIIVDDTKQIIEWSKYLKVDICDLYIYKNKNHAIRGYYFNKDAIQRSL